MITFILIQQLEYINRKYIYKYVDFKDMKD